MLIRTLDRRMTQLSDEGRNSGQATEIFSSRATLASALRSRLYACFIVSASEVHSAIGRRNMHSTLPRLSQSQRGCDSGVRSR